MNAVALYLFNRQEQAIVYQQRAVRKDEEESRHLKKAQPPQLSQQEQLQLQQQIYHELLNRQEQAIVHQQRAVRKDEEEIEHLKKLLRMSQQEQMQLQQQRYHEQLRCGKNIILPSPPRQLEPSISSSSSSSSQRSGKNIILTPPSQQLEPFNSSSLLSSPSSSSRNGKKIRLPLPIRTPLPQQQLDPSTSSSSYSSSSSSSASASSSSYIKEEPHSADINTQKVASDTSSPSRAIVDNLTSAQTTARLQSAIEEHADVNLSLKVTITRLKSAKEELEGDLEYYKEKYSNVVTKMDKANESNERQKLRYENLKRHENENVLNLKSENENLKRQFFSMNSSPFLIDLSLPYSRSVASASPSANRKRGIGEIN